MNTNYSQWNVLHYMWDSVTDFENGWNGLSGIHTINFLSDEPSIDIFVNELVKDNQLQCLPVFLSGAISARGTKKGPFFTGKNIAKKDNIPMISVADPMLDIAPELSIAWYTGGPDGNVMTNIQSVLMAVHRYQSQELILIGGSGGGFAALALGRGLRNRCSVIAWNPQTDIYKYSERFVKSYLREIFGFAHSTLRSADWANYCRPRTKKILSTDILSDETLTAPRRLLYLQNSSDWHRATHLNPLWLLTNETEVEEGSNRIDSQHLVEVREFAVGHEPPSSTLIASIINQFLDPNFVTSNTVFHLNR